MIPKVQKKVRLTFQEGMTDKQFALSAANVLSPRVEGSNISCSNSPKKPRAGESQSQEWDPCGSVLVLASMPSTGTKCLGTKLRDLRAPSVWEVWGKLYQKGTSRLGNTAYGAGFTWGYLQASLCFRRNVYL